MKCYRCGEEGDFLAERVDLGYNLYVDICGDCKRIVLRDAMTELFVSRIKERMKE